MTTSVYFIGFGFAFLISLAAFFLNPENEISKNNIIKGGACSLFLALMSWVGAVITVFSIIFTLIIKLMEKEKENKPLFTAQMAYENAQKNAERVKMKKEAEIEAKVNGILKIIHSYSDENKYEVRLTMLLNDDVKDKLRKYGYVCEDVLNLSDKVTKVSWYNCYLINN